MVVLLAWKAHGWLFSHGPVAVVLCGAPLVALVRKLWLVPAFLYLIAVLHVWLASRHESPGRLQNGRRRAAEEGRAEGLEKRGLACSRRLPRASPGLRAMGGCNPLDRFTYMFG